MSQKWCKTEQRGRAVSWVDNYHTLSRLLPLPLCLPLTVSSPTCPPLTRYSHADSAGHRRAHDHATGPRGSAKRPGVPALSLAPSTCAWADRVQRRAAARRALPRPVCGWVDHPLWCNSKWGCSVELVICERSGIQKGPLLKRSISLWEVF